MSDQRQSDPVIALVAEHRRIEAEWETFFAPAVTAPDDTVDAAIERFSAQQHRLEDQIADIVAISAAGIIAQVQLMRAIFEKTLRVDTTDRLFASIAAGVERLEAR